MDAINKQQTINKGGYFLFFFDNLVRAYGWAAKKKQMKPSNLHTIFERKKNTGKKTSQKKVKTALMTATLIQQITTKKK